MKTIVQNTNNWSSYIFEDDVSVSFTEAHIVTPEFIIGDLNSNNATMYENVTPPDDWSLNKYFFDGTTWTLNPDWREPPSEEGLV